MNDDDYIDLSVIIITLNEENHIRKTLSSLPKGCEIIVLDSHSSDATISIAKEFGALIKTRKFDNFSNQKNFALSFASRKWILSLDADEQLSSQLSDSIVSITKAANTQPKAFKLSRKLVFMKRKLKYGKSGDHPIRMFLKGSAKFENPIHEQLITDAPIEILDGDLYHFSYDSLSDYFNRFNTYTTKISQNHYQSGTKAPHLVFLVLRPWVDFIYRYFLRLGFLDGYPGYCYALFSSCYAFVKYAKLHEIQCSLVQHEIKN